MSKYISVVVLVAGAISAFGGLIAWDCATEPNYDDGWHIGDNGGYGFSAWELEGADNAGFFIGASYGNGEFPSGDIDVNNRSFGLWANSGDSAHAYRLFQTALEVGDIFQIDFDNGYIDVAGSVGVGLQNSDGQNLFEWYFVGGARRDPDPKPDPKLSGKAMPPRQGMMSLELVSGTFQPCGVQQERVA